VQGQLQEEPLAFAIETECAHCKRPLHLEMDSVLNYHVVGEDAEPLVFVPMVDFDALDDPSIIDAF
jgi:hypothetical protein